MKKIENFKVEEQKEALTLPPNGYILRLIKARIEKNEFGERLLISFDIDEGDYAHFYRNKYESSFNDGSQKWKGVIRLSIPETKSEFYDWQLKKFSNFVWALQESNPGYIWNWDETTLGGKLIGGLFGLREYDIEERKGFFTELRKLTSIQKIKSESFVIPETKYLTKKEKTEVYEELNDEGVPF